VERLGPAPPPPLPSPVPQPPDSDEPSQFAFKRSLTLIKLLHLWEDITDGYSEARGELPGWIRAADDEALVDDYRAVLQTRNRVAHAKPIPNDILAGAIAAAEGLAAVKQDLDDRPPSTDELILREVASSVLDDYLRQPNHGI